MQRYLKFSLTLIWVVFFSFATVIAFMNALNGIGGLATPITLITAPINVIWGASWAARVILSRD